MIYNARLLAEHQASRTRLRNIKKNVAYISGKRPGKFPGRKPQMLKHHGSEAQIRADLQLPLR